MTVGGQFTPFTQIAEMIKQHWKKIGIDADVKETERSLAFMKTNNIEHHILLWSVTGSENIYLFPRLVLPVDPVPNDTHLGIPFARWYATNGAQGRKPVVPGMVRAMELFRSAAGKKQPERVKIAQEIWKIICEECWVIGTVGLSPAFMACGLRRTPWGISPRARPTPNTCARPTRRTRPRSSSRREGFRAPDGSHAACQERPPGRWASGARLLQTDYGFAFGRERRAANVSGANNSRSGARGLASDWTICQRPGPANSGQRFPCSP